MVSSALLPREKRYQSCCESRITVWQAFEQALMRYQDLERQLADPTVIADRARFTQVAKEHGAIAKRVKPYLEYRRVSEEVAQAEALLASETDPEMRQYAQEEVAQRKVQQQALQA